MSEIGIFRMGGEWIKPFSGLQSLLPIGLAKSSVPSHLHREIQLT